MPIRSNPPPKSGSIPASGKAAEKTPVAKNAPTSVGPAAPASSAAVDGLDAPRRSTDAGKLTAMPPPPPMQPGGNITAGKTLAATFDAIQAPGGPAEARVLSNGLDAWNSRWDMLGAAKTSIDATYFIFEKDCFGYAFLGQLLKKQFEGVPVRVMTDSMADTFGEKGFTMAGRGKDYLEELVNAGGKAYVYHPIWQRPLDAVSNLVSGDPQFSALASNHDKILIVDGQKAVTGGRNVAIDYYADPKDWKGAWRDMDISLEGGATASGLKKALDDEINAGNVASAVTKDFLGNWSKKDIQLLGAAEMMDLWLHDPQLSDAQKAELRANPELQKPMVEDLVHRALERVQADLPADLKRQPSDGDVEFLHEQAKQLVSQLEARGSNQRFQTGGLPQRSTETKIIDQTSSAAGRANGIAPALKALVDSAKKKIVIENPYVVLTEDMMKSLEAASARGVKIEIITNSPLSTDSDVTQAFFLEDWPYILARCPTATIQVATGDRKFHTKSAVIDGEESFVSTYNLDLLSGHVNSEVGAVVKSKEVAADLLASFDADLKDPANGFLEYTIKRDADGKPVLKDGQPIVEFGPEHHLPRDLRETYAKKRETWGHQLRENFPMFEPLRHPALPG
ncbi:MAG TPA: phosphatidylserine/phosphatidylglycerophosphate/cardiolipin synthase family protein [Myxococcales bacterium]|jgi:phosphatidylserine/phosphatidylglycerophosphate/cardiolipin synthase-like enzyme